MFQCHLSVFSDSPPLQRRGMKEHCDCEKLGFVFVGNLINKVNYICRYMGCFLHKFKASAGFSFKTPILRVFNRQPHRRCCGVLQDTVKGFFSPYPYKHTWKETAVFRGMSVNKHSETPRQVLCDHCSTRSTRRQQHSKSNLRGGRRVTGHETMTH